jgi:CMP-N,N'-diacetyllegionaminic acid synthase
MKKCVLILARGGSKSIPRKNLVKVAGEPLISYPIKAALDSVCQDVWVSSEDDEIKEVARNFGAKIHRRPKEFAGDLSTDLECFTDFSLHNRGYDYIIHLRATSPQISPKIINEAVEIFESRYNEIDSLRSVVKIEKSPYKMWFLKYDGSLTPVIKGHHLHSSPRQTLEQAYYQNACIDIIKSNTIIEKGSMIGDKCLSFVMEEAYNIDIDTKKDLHKAKNLLES